MSKRGGCGGKKEERAQKRGRRGLMQALFVPNCLHVTRQISSGQKEGKQR